MSVNIPNLVRALDIYANCSDRRCADCQALYGTGYCPEEDSRQELLNLLMLLERYLDNEYDNHNERDRQYNISDEDFIRLLTGE
jgi:hypothetical protein